MDNTNSGNNTQISILKQFSSLLLLPPMDVPKCLIDWEDIQRHVQDHNSIKTIHVIQTKKYEAIHVDDLISIVEFIKHYYQYINIQKIYLCQNNLSVIHGSALAKLIQVTFATLEELDVSNNPLNASGLKHIVDTLISSTTNAASKSLKITTTKTARKASTAGGTATTAGDETDNTQHSTNATFSSRSLEGRDDNNHPIKLSFNKANLHGTEAGTMIGSLLRHYYLNLCELNLANNNIGNKGIKAIAASLCYNTSLRKLNVSYNKISDRGISILMDGLVKENQHPGGSAATNTESGTNTTDTGTSTAAKTAGVAINARRPQSSSSSIMELNVACNKMTSIGAGHITNALIQYPNRFKNLATLDVSLNQFGCDGGYHFSTLFTSRSYGHSKMTISAHLVELNLSQNNLKDDGIIDIANSLRNILSRNSSFSSRGTYDMGNDDDENKDTTDNDDDIMIFDDSNMVPLQKLDISYNLITNDGCYYIANMLRSNVLLERLIIANNAIRNDGMNELANALRDNTTLIELDISGNQMTDPVPFMNLFCHRYRDYSFLASDINYIIGRTNYNASTTTTSGNSNGSGSSSSMSSSNHHHMVSSPLKIFKYDNNNLSNMNEKRLEYAFYHFHRNVWLGSFLKQLQNNTLRVLNLWSYMHTDDEVIAITNTLRKIYITQQQQKERQRNPRLLESRIGVIGQTTPPLLTQVFFGNPYITDRGIQAFAAFIFECNHVKQVIHHNLNTPTVQGGSINPQSQSHQSASDSKKSNLVTSCSIQGWYVKDCIELTNESMTYISHALIKNKTLRILSLSNCNITSVGIKLLCNTLKTNTTLQRLTLDHNKIDDVGAKYIFQLIFQPNQQQQQQQGTAANATSISARLGLYNASPMITPTIVCCLQSLNLSNNMISDDAVTMIMQSFVPHDTDGSNDGNSNINPMLLIPSMKELYLQNNQITDIGISYLAKGCCNGLSSSSSLSSLVTNTNAANTSGIDYRTHHHQQSPPPITSLTQLNVSSNLLTHNGIEFIRQTLSTLSKSSLLCERQKQQ